jgi:Ca2+-binding EF-hand superfamily protein
MPRVFDRDLALELFSELDSDKDGKLSYKDFHDTLLFEL